MFFMRFFEFCFFSILGVRVVVCIVRRGSLDLESSRSWFGVKLFFIEEFFRFGDIG